MELTNNKGIDDALLARSPIESIKGSMAVEYATKNLFKLDHLKQLNNSALEEYLYIGVAGDIVRKLAPETESDPLALFVQLIIAFGNLIGRSSYMIIEGSPHYTNLFAVLVGTTGNGRKGTSWKQVSNVLKNLDIDWYNYRVIGGIASGETIIERIKDDLENDNSSKPYNTANTISGLDSKDKRLLIQESEFSGLLKTSSRDGNIISQILRKAWDSERIENQTKYQLSVCLTPHISLLGHITKEELAVTFAKNEAASGFGNRFLFLSVNRSKKLPFGGNAQNLNFDAERTRLMQAIAFARRCPEIKESAQSRSIWPQLYEDLTRERHGLLGAMLNRAAPIVRRLSLIFATLDCSKTIELNHTLAALALWSRSENTVETIFKNILGDKVANAILNLITENENGVSRTQIRDLFHKNEDKTRIDIALESLVDANLIYNIKIPPGPSGGKPTEKWLMRKLGR